MNHEDLMSIANLRKPITCIMYAHTYIYGYGFLDMWKCPNPF